MLDDTEFSAAQDLFGKAFKSSSPTMKERFKPLVDYHEQITGYRETNPNAIMHHQISQYGGPCENCGKPYRTSEASFCAACGNVKANEIK
jgi:hypothetical protein